MNSGTILLINGTSSSGKTSLVHALQDCLDEPFLEAGIDKFIWMLPERYLERPLWDEILGLAVKAGQPGHRLVNGMHQAIYVLAQNGCHVIADHVLVEPAWLRQCAELFSYLPAYLIGVRCPLDVLEQRESSRRNRTLGQARLQYPLIHAHRLYDIEVDTSLNSIEECASIIKTFLNSGTPPSALKQLKAGLFSGFSIRPARLADCPSLARIQVDSYCSAYFDIFPADYFAQFSYSEQEQDWFGFLSEQKEDALLVAESEHGEIVGYALARPGMTNLPPYDSELVSLHVRRIYQGLGIGRTLFLAAARAMKAVGYNQLMLWVLEKNAPACRFYERLGGSLLEPRQLSQGIAMEVAYGWQISDLLEKS